MSNAVTGALGASLQLGLTSLIVKPKRGIFDNTTGQVILIPQVTIEELHTDELEITDHPVEQGSNITDHAFKHPAEITVKMGFSNSPSSNGSLVNAAIGLAAADNSLVRTVANAIEIGSNLQSALTGANPNQVNAIYAQLLSLQSSRTLVNLLTGKRIYKDMLIKGLSVLNDDKSENALFISVNFRQIIIVNTQTVTLPQSTQALPQVTTSLQNLGTKALIPAPNYTP